MDTIYGGLITIIPIIVVITLNILIGRRLRHARNVALKLQRVCAEESRLRLEFTGILLIVSTTFILHTAPGVPPHCGVILMISEGSSACTTYS